MRRSGRFTLKLGVGRSGTTTASVGIPLSFVQAEDAARQPAAQRALRNQLRAIVCSERGACFTRR